MARKNVTIRELRQAAADRGWSEPRARVYRSSVKEVIWFCAVQPSFADVLDEYVSVGNASRQGAMRMALAALRAK